MSFFDQVYKQLFGQSSPKQKVLAHGLIKRSPHYQQEYLEFIQSDPFRDMVDAIYSSYELKLKDIEKMPAVHVLTSAYANGLAIPLNKEINTSEASYVFDWLKERVLSLDYQLANSDCSIIEKGDYIESKEKHYLKPIVGKEEVLNQRFGNILIEFIKIDDKPNFIKLTANIYSDRKYSKAMKFEKLAEYLFSETQNY